MKVIPAIDISAGKCVRLYQGNFEKKCEYEKSPLEMAMYYATEGATEIHIVDLDGAKNATLSQGKIINEIASHVSLTIQVGGGIRTTQQLEMLFEQGISRVVIGSLAVIQPKKVIDWLTQFGRDKFVLALDVKVDATLQPKLVTTGWQQASNLTLWELLEAYRDAGVKYVLCTDIHRDGALSSPNITLYAECVRRFPSLRWQGSGGVASLEDIVALKKQKMDSVIVGKALYENKFTLKQAIQMVESC